MRSDPERLLTLAYSSLSSDQQHAAFVRCLADEFDSHLISVQLDASQHRHVTCMDFDAQGKRVDEMAQLAARTPVQSPWFASEAARMLPVVGIMSDTMTGVSPSDLKRSDFYETILRPFDILHSFVFYLSTDGDRTVTLGLSRAAGAGAYTEDELARAKSLLPHLRNIQAIQALLEQESTESREGMNPPVWSLDARGQPCGGNAAANSDQAYALIPLRGRLQPVFPDDRLPFSSGLSAILAGRSLHARVPLRDRTGVPSAIAHIHRCLRDVSQHWLLANPSVALVRLSPIQQDHAGLADALRAWYGLTGSETRIALRLLDAASPREISEELHRSLETVRSQLKSVLAKTGTHSQMQLMALLHRLSGS